MQLRYQDLDRLVARKRAGTNLVRLQLGRQKEARCHNWAIVTIRQQPRWARGDEPDAARQGRQYPCVGGWGDRRARAARASASAAGWTSARSTVRSSSSGPSRDRTGQFEVPHRGRTDQSWRLDQEFQIIDHANCGPPLLGPARASQALGRVTPFNAHAAKDVATYAEYTAPARGFIEQVSNLRPFGDQYGRSLILLRNGSNANRDASRSWSRETRRFAIEEAFF